MKKFLILLVTILTLSLCACGSSAGSDSGEVSEESTIPQYIGLWVANEVYDIDTDTWSTVSDTMQISFKDDETYFEIVNGEVNRGTYEFNDPALLLFDGDTIRGHYTYDSKNDQVTRMFEDSLNLIYYYEKK